MNSLFRSVFALILTSAVALQAGESPVQKTTGTQDPIRLWPGEEISHETLNEAGRFQKINVPTLTPFLPEKTKRNGTALIVCPGGGYQVCDFFNHGTRLAQRLNPEGICVFVLKYRLLPSSPATTVADTALADALRAMRILRVRAAEFGIQPNRIGMVGYSAGANLTVHVASAFDPGHPDSPDPIERVSSRPDFIGLLCAWAGTGGKQCPYPLRKDSPPSFLCHSKLDTIAPVSVAEDITKNLKLLNVPVELHLFETGGHGMFTPNPASEGGRWPDLFLKWLKP